MAIGGRSLHVDVLQHHINAGVRHDCRLCPIAMALSRATGDAWIVGGHDFVWKARLYSPMVRLPAEVVAFIRRFDAGEECRPFSFTVEVPD
jgi:hypothetical protein